MICQASGQNCQCEQGSEDDHGWAKKKRASTRPPKRPPTRTLVRKQFCDANESRPLAHGCTRPVGGLPSMNRAQHPRLGLNCLSVLLSAPPARRLPPLVPGPLIPVSKLSDLSRCMQVIFNDVCVAWPPINYRPRVRVCVSCIGGVIVPLGQETVNAVSQRKDLLN